MNKIKEKIMNVVDSNGFLKAATVNAAASTAMVVSSATSAPAFAAEAGDTSAITGGMSTLTTVMGDLWTFMVANPLMCVYMAAGVSTVCFGLIRKGKRASR